MALQVTATITAQPGSEAAVRDALQSLVRATREKEEGCLSYSLYVSAADPTAFVTIESWRGQDDLDAHMQTEHVQAALGAVGDQLAAPPAIHPLEPIDLAD